MNTSVALPHAIPILNYHTVSDAPAPGIAPFAVGPGDLASHLDLVVAGGYRAVTISELVEMMDGATRLEPGTVAITFDDGFEDNLTVAAPMLVARGLPATVYATTGFLAGAGAGQSGEPRSTPGPAPYPPPGRMIRWDNLADLEACGVEVGSHAHTHRQLDVLARSEARAEIRLSKDLLEAALGHAVPSFAYPHGYASRWVENEVRSCGFRSACGVGNAFSHRQDNRWHLSRLTVVAATTAEEVRSWLRCSGAPIARPREHLKTKAWREARRAIALYQRATSHADATRKTA